MTSKRIRLISFIIIAYMIPCLAWWTVLLYQKNEDIYAYQQAISINETPESFPSVESFKSKYQRQKYMILGEGLVFAISLITGIWIINKAAQDEFKIAQLKNNFLVSITHELKTPLASIKMILETILNKPQLDRTKQIKISENALKETNRLESMVNKLLLTAKIEDQYQYNFETVQLSAFLASIISKHPYPDGRKPVQLECPENITAEIDHEALKSVIQNLVENAVKYSEDEEQIIIRVKKNNQFLDIDCIDHGRGINDTEKKEVLKKFYRIGDEEFRSTEGSGLGLFIVNEIIKSHHGTLTILDNQPKGTTIRVSIPSHQTRQLV